jgi:hypothetical protein
MDRVNEKVFHNTREIPLLQQAVSSATVTHAETIGYTHDNYDVNHKLKTI